MPFATHAFFSSLRARRGTRMVFGTLVAMGMGLSFMPPAAANDPLAALVGGEEIPQSALEQAAASELLDLRQKIHEVYATTLDEMIAQKLLLAEANNRGISLEELETLEVIDKVSLVTDAELNAWYAAHAHEVGGQPLDVIRAQLTGYLQEEQRVLRRLAFLDELKEKTPIKILLEPFRLDVPAGDGPRRGLATAPVEIVEYSDFECPYCTRGADTLDLVLERYGDQISFVFRHYPLPFHEHAQMAAQAASCAGDQGEFYAYHDLLFANTHALTQEDLVQYARKIGLNEKPFATCLTSQKHAGTVAEDLASGQRLGVTGTPAFFINGRPLLGAQPLDAFVRVIDEELAAR
jgi:predicted DsbA family dithiol-disulfide isomerase